MRSHITAFLLVGCCPLSLAAAQEVPQVTSPSVQVEGDETEDEEQGGVGSAGEIVVVASRIRGEVDVPQQPVAVFDEEEIAAYGVSSIDELLQAISPQTGSGRGRGEGRPVILLNGQRISSFREMRSIPPEAIRRLQVLPEEVALRFGYPPNQRVVNIILKDNFSSTQASGEFNYPTRGGYSNYELEGGLFRIDGQRRTTIEAKITDTSLLTEAERNVIQAPGSVPSVASDPDPAEFRSLAAASREITLGATSAMGLGKDGLGGSLTLNGAYTRTDTRSLSGLDTALLRAPDGTTALRSLDDPLRTRVGSDALQGGLAYNRPIGTWQLTGTVDASYTDSTTRVDRRRDLTALQSAAALGTLPITGLLSTVSAAGFDTARSKDFGGSGLVTLAGNLLRLPAGDASATLRAGFDYDRSDNEDSRSNLGSVVLDRSDLSAGLNLALPLTSRREDILSGFGDLTLNLSGGFNHLSDFGTLADWSAGLTWSPTSKLSLQASYIVDEAAPTLSQLASPQVLSYNVSTYDFLRGQTALVTVISGGNPDLVAERQRDIKLSLNWQLPVFERSNLVVEYFRNRSSDVTQTFPLLTPAIEAAFPGRVTRDLSGLLTSIDRRPVTFDEIASSRMRWGFNFGGRLGAPSPAGEQVAGGRARPAGGAGELAGALGGRGPGGMARGGPGSRWNLSLYHTWRFTDTVRVASGAARLDQLEGNAISAGGVPRHALEFEGGLFRNGYGLRVQGEWNASAAVVGSGLPGSSDLRFGSTFDLSLRTFVNLDQLPSVVERMPFLKGTRISFTVDNLLNQRQRVTDQNGDVPLAYQAAFREPQGRVVGIDLRKMF